MRGLTGQCLLLRLQLLAPLPTVEYVQTPGEFVSGQVRSVREKVDQLAGSVAETVAAEAQQVSTVRSQVGEYIREQRSAARVSLRELARTAGVSNPYLSQVERGLRKPSAEILAAIAKGLQISAETLYEQAGILDRRAGNPDTVAAIPSDDQLSQRHNTVLLGLYETYVREHAAAPPVPAATARGRTPGDHPNPSKETA